MSNGETVELEFVDESPPGYLVPNGSEVIKNRFFGMPITPLTRHQRVAFNVMVKVAYEELLKDSDQRVFEIDTNDFLESMGIDTKKRKGSHLFSKVFVDDEGWERETDEYALEQTLKDLIGLSIITRHKNPKDGKTTYAVEGNVYVSDFKLEREKVTFHFGEVVRSKILSVGNAYIMSMPVIANLKSSYSVALFEQLEQRRDFCRWEVDLQALRDLMGLKDTQYKYMRDFKKSVLARAIDEINEKTHYIVRYEQKKKGRKISKIVFIWTIEDSDDDLETWKKFIRKNFTNVPLLKNRVGEDKSFHLIQVAESGFLYNGYNPDYYYDGEVAKRIWKFMYENQDRLLIKQDPDSPDSPENLDLEDKDYSSYYGKDFLYDGEMYNDIVLIVPRNGDLLKVKFQTGETMLLPEDVLNKGLIF